MSQASPSRARIALLIAGGVSLATALLSLILGGNVVPHADPGSHAFSRSALGYKAFVELLERLEVPVLVSRHDSAARAGDFGVLVVAEPPEMLSVVRPLVEASRKTLVILPKWEGEPSPERPGWIAGATLRAASDVEAVLALVAAGEIVRPAAAPRAWSASIGLPVSPALAEPQLFRPASHGPEIEPIVWSDDGILVGEMRYGMSRTWIVSDPDLFNNHGLGRGENAALALGLVEALRDGAGAVVVDETVHGFQSEPSLWRALLEWPLVLATLQGLVCVVVLVWAAAGRFGAPETPPAPFPRGADQLIANTATLLQLGGHAQHTLRHYHRILVRDVARQLHASPRLDRAALVSWLDRLGKSRGVSANLAALDREVDDVVSGRTRAQAAVAVARRLHHWREEMLHGHRRRS